MSSKTKAISFYFLMHGLALVALLVSLRAAIFWQTGHPAACGVAGCLVAAALIVAARMYFDRNYK